MSAELQNDTLVDIFNLATVNMKQKEIQRFAEDYFRLLESEDVDLDTLLEITDTGDLHGDDNEFHKYLLLYLEEPEESYEDDEEEDW